MTRLVPVLVNPRDGHAVASDVLNGLAKGTLREVGWGRPARDDLAYAQQPFLEAFVIPTLVEEAANLDFSDILNWRTHEHP